MGDQARLTLSPSAMTVSIDGVNIQTSTWNKTLSLLAQQATLRQGELTFGTFDNDGSLKAIHSITPTQTLNHLENTVRPQAKVTLNEWGIGGTDGTQLISFPTLKDAQDHIQLVADAAQATIPFTLAGLLPKSTVDLTYGPEGVTTGSLKALSQAQLEAHLLSDFTEEDSPEPERQLDEDSPVSNETGEEHADPAAAEVPAQQEGTYLFDDLEPIEEPRKGLLQKVPDTLSGIELPSFLDSTRNKILVGGGVLLLVAGTAGLAAPLLGGAKESSEQAELTETSVSVPVGYSETPSWSLDIPEDAQIKSTRTATAIFNDDLMSLYNTETGKKIRDIDLPGAIETLGEVTIDGEPALVFSAADQLIAWPQSAGSDGALISAELDPSAQISSSGDSLLVRTTDSTSVLTQDGLKTVNVPAGLTAMSATDEQVIAGSFASEITRLSISDSKAEKIELQAPREGQEIQSWKHADDSIIATVWAENPNAVCTQTDDSGCGEKATFAIHNVSDGSLAASYDVTLEEVSSLKWVEGESDEYGAFGSRVFDESTGQEVTMLPDELTAERIKGKFILTTNDSGNTIAFHSNNSGYELTSILLAQTEESVVLQEGEQIVSYPVE